MSEPLTFQEKLELRRKHLASIDAYLASPAHVGYLEAQRAELKDVEDEILNGEFPDLAALHFARGRRSVIKENFTLFEDARERLQANIFQMEEVEQQNTPTY